MMEIFWTMLASQDRKRIREYIAEQNLMAAIVPDERIGYSASSLAGQPYKGRNGRVEGTGNWLFTPILFWFMRSTASVEVYVLRVLHTAQKWPCTQSGIIFSFLVYCPPVRAIYSEQSCLGRYGAVSEEPPRILAQCGRGAVTGSLRLPALCALDFKILSVSVVLPLHPEFFLPVCYAIRLRSTG
ncbi:type II toxin-antitoxin system RelE/ParE family toxin [Escherichia coli]|nr:type II toxin-antitoxin system RelE/ParE family toxin [Escherichia coli]